MLNCKAESIADDTMDSVSDEPLIEIDKACDAPSLLIVASASDPNTIFCEYCNKQVGRAQLRHHIAYYHRPKKLQCHLCPSKFKYPSLLLAHTLTHEKNRERKFSCEFCEQKFFSKSIYRSHIKRHENRPLVECDQCEKKFYDNCTLNKHKRQQHLDNVPPPPSDVKLYAPTESYELSEKCRACLCDDPLQLFDWNNIIDESSETTSESITYAECFSFCTQLDASADTQLPQKLCSNCATELKNAFNFIQKSRQSDNELRLIEQPKTKSEPTEYEWISTEIELLDPASEFPIDVNENSNELYDLPSPQTAEVPTEQSSKVPFKRRRRRRNQEPVRTEEQKPCNESATAQQRFSCDYCDKSDLNKDQLRHHIAYYHRPKTLMCHACPRTFKYPSLLQAHETTHEKDRERNYECEHCDQKFFTKKSAQAHTKVHESNRQPIFKCDHCQKSFYNQRSLTLHTRIHLGQTVDCKICSKKCVRVSDLKVHLLTHCNDLPFKCTLCDKAYTHAGQLNTHLRNHQGIRYKCDMCDKDYPHQSTLSIHRKSHTGKPLECRICGKGFVKKQAMQRHINGVHKVTDPAEVNKLIVKVKTNDFPMRAPNGCAKYAVHRTPVSEDSLDLLNQ